MKAKSESARKNAVNVSKDNLEGIFEDLLKDIYWAEKHLVKAIPKMAKASYNEELKKAFDDHLEQTQRHVLRIENCFEIMNEKAVAKKCDAMDGLIKEGADAIESYDPGHARDAALIAAAQKVEHYEISAYGTLRTMATVLGKGDCASLLEETKHEEAQTDTKLTELSEMINQYAAELEVEKV